MRHSEIESTERFRILEQAVAQVEGALMITDAELDLPGPRIVYVNPAFTSITGYSAEEVIGCSPRMLQGPRTERSELDRMRLELVTKRSFRGQTRNYRKDGSEFVLEWQVSAVINDAGVVTNYVALQQDVTADVRARKIHADAGRLHTAARLTAGIAHDFNNLLGALTGLAHTLRDQLDDPEDARWTAQEIIAIVDRATVLTRQLQIAGYGAHRELIGTEAAVGPAREQRGTSLNRVVLGVESLLRQFVESGVDLKVEVPPDEVTVHASVSDMERVLINLVANANSAMPSGGTIELKLETVRLGETEAQAHGASAGEYAALWVSDTGYGMDEATKSRIFEPFFTTKRGQAGSGLGLSNVYDCIRNLNGIVKVSSEPGRGSQFGIHLPLYSSEEFASASGTSP